MLASIANSMITERAATQGLGFMHLGPAPQRLSLARNASENVLMGHRELHMGESMILWPRTVGLAQQRKQRDETNIAITRAGETFPVKQCTSPSLRIPGRKLRGGPPATISFN